MARGQFQIDAAQLQVRVLVFDPQVGKRNLAVHDNSPYLSASVGDFVRVISSLAELRPFSVQMALEFVVEDDAKWAAASAFDAGRFGMKEPIEFRVVFGFARL